MSTIKITRTESTISVSTPYSPELPQRAKQLSGRWDREAAVWVFPIQAEPQVKALYMDVYGMWDSVESDTVTVVCRNDNEYSVTCDSIVLHGRVVARATGRDSGAKTADGIVLLSGKFRSGGSVKNWRTVCDEGTTFKILNVPRAKADQMVSGDSWCKCSIEEPTTVDRAALMAERERLLARIAEIDLLLNK